MAYQVGYTDNTGSEGLAHRQFLHVVKALAEANGWETLRHVTSGAVHELILKGEGLAGTDEIYVGMRAYHDAGADYYNVTVAGFTGYVSASPFTSQPGFFESGIPAHNQRIDYWLAVSPRRIAFGLKVGTPVYEHGYMGFFLPYATPSQYPYPMAIGGMLQMPAGGALTGTAATRYSETTHSMYAKGARPNLRARTVGGVWAQVDAWPWSAGYTQGDRNFLASTANYQLRDTGDTYHLLPVVLNDNGPNVYGELDGVRYISGFNNTVESTLEIEGVDWVVLEDVSRTGFSDYYALRLD